MNEHDGFTIENNTLVKFEGEQEIVQIPEAVTKIGDYAFMNNEKLKSVELHNGIVSIGDSSFYGCVNLESIKLAAHLDEIGSCAFKGCSKLADSQGFVIVNGILFDYFGEGGNVVVPEGVSALGDYSFDRCSLLQRNHVDLISIKLPNTLTCIGSDVFKHCDYLTEVTIPNNVKMIGERAFERNRCLEKVKMSKHIAKIGDYAFAGCSITSVKLPGTLLSIGEGAFMNNKLKELLLPDDIESIEKKAFVSQMYDFFTLVVKKGTQTEGTIKKYLKKNKNNIKYID